MKGLDAQCTCRGETIYSPDSFQKLPSLKGHEEQGEQIGLKILPGLLLEDQKVYAPISVRRCEDVTRFLRRQGSKLICVLETSVRWNYGKCT